MQAILDKFGRVVIPKPIRVRLGLKPGSRLKIEEKERQLLLEPADDQPCLVEMNGLLVFSGAAAGDLSGAVRAQREARLGKIGFPTGR